MEKKEKLINGFQIRSIVKRRMDEGWTKEQFIHEMGLYWDDEELHFLRGALK